MKLYEISDALERWYYEHDLGNDGEDKQALDDLGALKLEFDQKVGNIGRLIKNLEAESAAVSYEISRLKDRRDVLDHKAERLRKYVAYCLGEGTRWADACVAFTWRPSEAVEVDEALLPADYFRVKEVRTPDKELIKDTLKGGGVVPGAMLVKKQNLQLK